MNSPACGFTKQKHNPKQSTYKEIQLLLPKLGKIVFFFECCLDPRLAYSSDVRTRRPVRPDSAHLSNSLPSLLKKLVWHGENISEP